MLSTLSSSPATIEYFASSVYFLRLYKMRYFLTPISKNASKAPIQSSIIAYLITSLPFSFFMVTSQAPKIGSVGFSDETFNKNSLFSFSGSAGIPERCLTAYS